MAVKILIKRTVPENKIKDLGPLLKRLRILATNHPGYISGETLRCLDKPGEYLVISTWQSVEDWQTWEQDAERREISQMIDSLIGHRADYQIYLYG
jgi:heme-degrading monooxygenase HmoA